MLRQRSPASPWTQSWGAFRDSCMTATRGRSPRGPHWVPGHIALQSVGCTFQETQMPGIPFLSLWAGKRSHVLLKSAQPQESALTSCRDPAGFRLHRAQGPGFGWARDAQGAAGDGWVHPQPRARRGQGIGFSQAQSKTQATLGSGNM